MSEHDDELARRYRALAREEPPAALDAAILAASRRALVRRPAPQRWAIPVSIAAVLVLALGITLQVRRDEPGIETSLPTPPAPPSTSPAPPSAPATPRISPAPTIQSATTPTSPAPRSQAAPAPQSPARSKLAAPAAREPAAPPAAATEAAAPALRGFAREEAVAQPGAPAETAARKDKEGAPLPEAKRATAANLGKREAVTLDAATPNAAAALERIARLRSEGRTREADDALAQFRRDFPGYRIPEATWDRVKPR